MDKDRGDEETEGKWQAGHNEGLQARAGVRREEELSECREGQRLCRR